MSTSNLPASAEKGTSAAIRQAAARAATEDLGAWAADLLWADVPPAVRARLGLVLLDVLGVTVVGSRQLDQRALVEAWRPASGPAPLVGVGSSVTVDAAAWLNAVAMVRLELDEGHKYAAGHPAAHAVPAVLALAAELGSTGPDTMASLLVAYETATRFGRATRLQPRAHPHGSWGVAGAAAGCARLLMLSGHAVAAAIDTGAGLPIAGHFSSALDGNPVRDAWMGASNLSGLTAARMAAAGVARNTGTAAGSLGTLLGGFDATEVTAELGTRWDVDLGYFKRHASCSFTHPAADAVLEIRSAVDGVGSDGGDRLDGITGIVVETHSLAAGLDRTTWDGRLSALFSTPFVVAAALVHGHVGPEVSADGGLHDPRVQALARKVVVRVARDLDARLPDERPARVTIRAGDAEHIVEVPNPIGDSAHHPLTEDDVLALLEQSLGSPAPGGVVHEVVSALPHCDDVASTLSRLAGA